jgi:hypothetical protein
MWQSKGKDGGKMKVYQLIAELQKYDLDTEVFMSIDEEGNGFAQLDVAQENAMEDMENGEIVDGVILWPGGAEYWEAVE